jgi:hypothetical protein
MTNYDLLQAQQDVASLRGQIAHLLATLEVINLKVDGNAVFQNAAAIVQPSSSPATAETWHDFPAGVNSWGNGTGGWKKYRMNVDGSVEVSISLRQIGTRTDGITVLSAGALPTGYQPVSGAKRLPVSLDTPGVAFYSSNHTPIMSFNTDGSVTVTGVNAATAPSQLDCNGIVTLV